MRAFMIVMGILYISAGAGGVLSAIDLPLSFTPDVPSALAFILIGIMLLYSSLRSKDIASFMTVSLGLGTIIMLVHVLAFGASYADTVILGEKFDPAPRDYNPAAILLGIACIMGLWYYRPYKTSCMRRNVRDRMDLS